MTRSHQHPFMVFSILLILPGFAGADVYAQGFKGLTGGKNEMVMKRKLAAFVTLKKKRIRMEAIVQGGVTMEVAEVLKTKLITDVQKDTDFVVDEVSPETILKFTITAFDVEHRQGTRQVGSQTASFTLVTGNIEVSYQAIDAFNNAPLDSENLSASFKQDYPPSSTSGDSVWGIFRSSAKADPSLPPSKTEMRNFLINNIVSQMAQRATPIEQSFIVPLPRGKLDQISKVAQTRSWGKVLEMSETMTPFQKPDDDSYRLYLIGLANEALAYEQKTNEKTLEYLSKARKNYDDAKTGKPKEEKYLAPWTRVDKAVAQYSQIKRQQEEYDRIVAEAKARSQPPSEGKDTTPVAPPPAPPKTWDNRMVIELWKTGHATEQEMINYIQDAESVRFSTGPTEILELKRSAVPEGVINAMKKRMNPSTRPSPPPTPTPTPKPTPKRPTTKKP